MKKRKHKSFKLTAPSIFIFAVLFYNFTYAEQHSFRSSNAHSSSQESKVSSNHFLDFTDSVLFRTIYSLDCGEDTTPALSELGDQLNWLSKSNAVSEKKMENITWNYLARWCSTLFENAQNRVYDYKDLKSQLSKGCYESLSEPLRDFLKSVQEDSQWKDPSQKISSIENIENAFDQFKTIRGKQQNTYCQSHAFFRNEAHSGDHTKKKFWRDFSGAPKYEAYLKEHPHLIPSEQKEKSTHKRIPLGERIKKLFSRKKKAPYARAVPLSPPETAPPTSIAKASSHQASSSAQNKSSNASRAVSSTLNKTDRKKLDKSLEALVKLSACQSSSTEEIHSDLDKIQSYAKNSADQKLIRNKLFVALDKAFYTEESDKNNKDKRNLRHLTQKLLTTALSNKASTTRNSSFGKNRELQLAYIKKLHPTPALNPFCGKSAAVETVEKKGPKEETVDETSVQTEGSQTETESGEEVMEEDASTQTEDPQTETEGSEEVMEEDTPAQTEDPQTETEGSEEVMEEDTPAQTEGSQTETEGSEDAMKEDAPAQTEGSQTETESGEEVMGEDASTQTEDPQTETEGSEEVVESSSILDSSPADPQKPTSEKDEFLKRVDQETRDLANTMPAQESTAEKKPSETSPPPKEEKASTDKSLPPPSPAESSTLSEGHQDTSASQPAKIAPKETELPTAIETAKQTIKKAPQKVVLPPKNNSPTNPTDPSPAHDNGTTQAPEKSSDELADQQFLQSFWSAVSEEEAPPPTQKGLDMKSVFPDSASTASEIPEYTEKLTKLNEQAALDYVLAGQLAEEVFAQFQGDKSDKTIREFRNDVILISKLPGAGPEGQDLLVAEGINQETVAKLYPTSSQKMKTQGVPLTGPRANAFAVFFNKQLAIINDATLEAARKANSPPPPPAVEE